MKYLLWLLKAAIFFTLFAFALNNQQTVTVPVDSDEAAVVAAAMESDKVKKATEGMSVVKTILVRNKLVNLIVKPAK